jgi:isoquinoline 1-oxidoreductase alpha subunit
MITLNINGQPHQVDVAPETPLLWVIREWIGLTGTKYGCGIAQCGACSVHLDGAVTRSCSVPVGTVGAARIVTIEGLSADGLSHPVQQAWLRRTAMRILPVRPDHGGGGLACSDAEADR